ncbi:hypothetical protein CASFOL_018624 [Castilleja foliolosa]|uniref:Transmembrane and coiled-coil domain-containing protein 4 n=1 Tax=Castilleja foliolosa TaxID=1961234 RepID=A0ABD3D7A3_9LAMI
MSSSTSMLTATQKYVAGALLSMALNQAEIHQTQPLGFQSAEDSGESEERLSCSSPGSVSDDHPPWVHESSGLLRLVFKVLEIDSRAWSELEETAAKSPEKQHVGSLLRKLAEESGDMSPEGADKQTALINGVDKLSSGMEKSPSDYDSRKEKQREYEHECREKFPTPDKSPDSKPVENNIPDDTSRQEINVTTSIVEQDNRKSISQADERTMEEAATLSYEKKVMVLYELLSACLAVIPEDDLKSTKRMKGYDARHRVALRLIAAWFDIKWIKMEAIETILACSAMSLVKEVESQEGQSPKNSWDKWKRGGIIGAAALTGGTLMAITGGLAAPAIAAGFSALAPTIGTIIPVIGAHGLAAVATAAGSAAGSVAVAASFGAAGAGLTGTKVARRIGDVDGFEFKAIGQNHNQGRLAVEISVSGFVFEEDDFIRPWEEQHGNLERYALEWESKNLIAVSTAIQDWLTSKIAVEVMKRGAMLTVLHGLMTAIAWPTALLSLSDFIDSQWTIAIDRSDKAGKMLAEVLLKGLQGNRPVTLVGFSLGTRVIFRCLQSLAESEKGAGLVERVVLLGAPIAIKDMNWEATRKVVAGRYVNAYSTNDWMLGVVFRANLLTKGLAGIQPVDVPGIENVDVTEIIDGHSSYLWGTQEILEQLELDDYYSVHNRKIVKS